MFNRKTQTETTGLEDAIDAALFELKAHDAHSDEYSKIVDQLDKLYKIKSSYDKDNKTSVSMDQIVAVVGNLAGIVMILGYENAHVVTSKALGFVMKSKTL